MNFPHSKLSRRAFTLVEVLVVVALLSFIVLALMAVFSSTQRAFRASVTQTDVLETGRSAVDLIVSDLRGLTPSYGTSNFFSGNIDCPVNFFVVGNSTFYRPLLQKLPGSTLLRPNLLNWFFILGRENTKWTATGYIVDSGSTNALYPLYRFYAETNISISPQRLYNQFNLAVANADFSSMSHLADGVVHLTVRAFDNQGRWIQQFNFPYYTNALNTYYYGAVDGEQQFFMFSNTIPASVELEVGVLEDRTIARAESLSIPNQWPMNNIAQSNYLSGAAGAVHIFRQRVSMPNFDPSAYQ